MVPPSTSHHFSTSFVDREMFLRTRSVHGMVPLLDGCGNLVFDTADGRAAEEGRIRDDQVSVAYDDKKGRRIGLPRQLWQ